MRRDGCDETMPQTVAVVSTTARVVPEPRALEKGIGEKRKRSVKVKKRTEESDLLFICLLHWQREREF